MEAVKDNNNNTNSLINTATSLEILELSDEATLSDNKKAYIRLAKLWHPDKNDTDDTAEQKLKDINKAYCHLSTHHAADIELQNLNEHQTENLDSVYKIHFNSESVYIAFHTSMVWYRPSTTCA